MLALMIVYLIASLACSPTRACKGFAVLGMFLTLVGLGITIRHVWLLHLPAEQVPDCSPGFDYLMSHFPWNEAFVIMFKSSGECVGKPGTLLGITLPTWTLVSFAVYLFANIWIMTRKAVGSNKN